MDIANRMHLSPALAFLLGLVLTGAVYFVDSQAGSEVTFSIFYAVPVLIVAASAGQKSGVILGGIAAAAWLTEDLQPGRNYANGATPFVNALIRFAFFGAVALLSERSETGGRERRSAARSESPEGIKSPKFLREIAEREVARARRHLDPVTVACLGCDDLKRGTDRSGATGKDEALREFAQIFQATLRTTDVVARSADDEFLLLLPEANLDGARLVCDKLYSRLREAMRRRGWELDFTLGAVTYKRPSESIEEMLHRATAAMHALRSTGARGVSVEPA